MVTPQSAFSELGITGSEARILESLINEGPATGSAMAARIGINKSVAYFVLEQLTQKGLASFLVVNKKREYRTIETDILRFKLEERKRAFLKNLGSMQSILETVKKKRKRTIFNVFEGWEGMKTAFNDIITTLKSEDDYFVFAVDVPEKIIPRFRRFIRRFHLARSQKRINCKILVSDKLRSTIGADRKNEKHTSVLFVPSTYSMPMAANIYASKVLLAIWSDPPLALTVENEDVSKSFRAFFHLLWKSGTV